MLKPLALRAVYMYIDQTFVTPLCSSLNLIAAGILLTTIHILWLIILVETIYFTKFIMCEQ